MTRPGKRYERKGWVLPSLVSWVHNWPRLRDAVFGGIPAPLRPVVAPLARRGVRRQLRGHGIGIHTAPEIHAIGCRDLLALSDFLADKPFFMGETATALDAVAYGLLPNILNVPIESPLVEAARERKNLAQFIDRMAGLYFGD